MQLTDLPEPHKIKYAVIAALFLLVSFAALTFSYTMRWSSPPPAAVQISLIPSIPTPPPPEPKPQETPEPEPEPEPEPDAAAAEREAEIIRAKEEEKRKKEEEEEKRKREEEKQRKEEEQRKREEEEKRKEEEEQRKREEEERRKAEEQARIQAEAAAAEAARQRAFESRAARIADKYAARIIDRINDYLITPGSVPNDSDIVVIIYVRLNADGSLIGIPEIYESSGFPEYDDAAVRAVLRAAPLPIPKEKFITEDEDLMRQFLEHRLYISPL